MQRLMELGEDLEDHSAESGANPSTAEMYVLLLQEEQMWIKMHDGYALAAKEYNGVGDAKNARRMARKALGSGLLCRRAVGEGSGYEGNDDSESYRDMLRLLENPRGHGSWRFRLRLQGVEDEVEDGGDDEGEGGWEYGEEPEYEEYEEEA